MCDTSLTIKYSNTEETECISKYYKHFTYLPGIIIYHVKQTNSETSSFPLPVDCN